MCQLLTGKLLFTDGSDFKLSSSDVLSFYPYYYGEQRQCICIEIIDDYCVEYNETFRVELIPVEDSGATVIMENYTLVTIEDDDSKYKLYEYSLRYRWTIYVPGVVGTSLTTTVLQVLINTPCL